MRKSVDDNPVASSFAVVSSITAPDESKHLIPVEQDRFPAVPLHTRIARGGIKFLKWTSYVALTSGAVTAAAYFTTGHALLKNSLSPEGAVMASSIGGVIASAMEQGKTKDNYFEIDNNGKAIGCYVQPPIPPNNKDYTVSCNQPNGDDTFRPTEKIPVSYQSFDKGIEGIYPVMPAKEKIMNAAPDRPVGKTLIDELRVEFVRLKWKFGL
ncbi:MAG TPA: hypothetical protein DCY07_08295 [Rhodospirillaceae bacterium]|nr:hypothetical protein [Rhodospirillaceae bacterium]